MIEMLKLKLVFSEFSDNKKRRGTDSGDEG